MKISLKGTQRTTYSTELNFKKLKKNHLDRNKNNMLQSKKKMILTYSNNTGVLHVINMHWEIKKPNIFGTLKNIKEYLLPVC